MSVVPVLVPMNFIGPALGGVLFIAIMSLVPHPARRSFNAIFATGAVGAYIGGAFGVWELVYPILATPVVYLGMRSYRGYRCRMAYACCLGPAPSPRGASHLALCADFFAGMHGLRLGNRGVVPRRSAVHLRQTCSCACQFTEHA